MNKIIQTLTLIFVSALFFGLHIPQIQAQGDMSQQTVLEARVAEVMHEGETEVAGQKQPFQVLKLEVTGETMKGSVIRVEHGKIPMASVTEYHLNDRVMLTKVETAEGEPLYVISDYIRRPALAKLLILFIVLTLVVAKWRGLTSLLGLGVTFAVIFLYILPKLISGSDPVSVAIVGALLIIPITFYLSHGINPKSTIAIVGTVLSLSITGVLAKIFVDAAHLTGFASEEAAFLQTATAGSINIKGLLLAGTIIGALGVLDDVTVAQAAVVEQLKNTSSTLKFKDLYLKAMSVGQDHIASMVNTLVLVYAGASLPLLLLFINSPQPFLQVVNYEVIADEVIKTLVGSIGLIIAVPVTTFLAAAAAVAPALPESLQDKPGSAKDKGKKQFFSRAQSR